MKYYISDKKEEALAVHSCVTSKTNSGSMYLYAVDEEDMRMFEETASNYKIEIANVSAYRGICMMSY